MEERRRRFEPTAREHPPEYAPVVTGLEARHQTAVEVGHSFDRHGEARDRGRA
nr:hypothetical protein [Nocardiopsis deserti]